MADIAQGLRFAVDLSKGLIQRPQREVLMRGDKSANKIVITVTDAEEPANLAGAGVSGMFVRQSGLEVPLTGSVSGNVITVVLSDHCYVESGHYEAFVRLKVGGTLRTILLISGEVHKDGDGAVVDVEDIIPSLDDLLAQIEEMRRVTAAANTATAKANTAASGADAARDAANIAADGANTAAAGANAAKDAANTAAAKIDGMTVSATGLEAGKAPTATISETGGHKHIAFGIPKGDTGDTGATPNLTVGNVTTGAPGSNAEVSIRGTAEDPVLDLTIPRGDTGSLGNLMINGKAPDASGRVELSAQDVSAYPDSSIRTVALSLAASAWTGSGPYTATISQSGVTPNTWVEFRLTEASMLHYSAAIDWETSAGQISLTTTAKPTGFINGTMVLMEVV